MSKTKVEAVPVEPCVYMVEVDWSSISEPKNGDGYSDQELEEWAREYCKDLPLTAVFRETRGPRVFFDCPILSPKEVQARIEAERERRVQERIERERREEAARVKALELNGSDYAIRWAEGRVLASSPPPETLAVVGRAKTILEKRGWTYLRIVADGCVEGAYNLTRSNEDQR